MIGLLFKISNNAFLGSGNFYSLSSRLEFYHICVTFEHFQYIEVECLADINRNIALL